MIKNRVYPKLGPQMYRSVRSISWRWEKQEIVFRLPGWYCNESDESVHTREDILSSCMKLYQRGVILARFGNEMTWLVYLRKMTKKQIADAVGMNLETYELISSGNKMPDFDELILIEAFLNHNPTCALNATNAKNRHQIQYHVKQAKMLLAELQVGSTGAFFLDIPNATVKR